MTKAEFVETISRELDTSFALPTQLPSNEIERITDQSSTWFYENYREAVMMHYYVIRREELNTPEFRASGRIISMPDCCVSVWEVKEISGAGLLGNIDRDFADNKLIASEIYLSPFSGDSLVFRTAQYAIFDLTRAFFLEWVQYDYNRRTKQLKILGRDPVHDVCIKVYNKIPDEKLYEDYFFTRYVTAKAKIALGRMLGQFNFQLMGGITINAADVKSEGTEELAKIEQEIKDEDSPDYFFTWHALIPPILMVGSFFMEKVQTVSEYIV